MAKIAENIEAEVKAGKLVLTIDPSVDLGPSSTGKTNVCASTRGFCNFAVGDKMITLSLNAMHPRKL